MHFSAAVLAAVATFVGMASAINPIEIKDRHFFDSVTGEPFWIKGVDYQPGGSAAHEAGADPLSDIDTCARDIYLFQQLGINTIRVYSIDPDVNHDACMTLLAAAGIYLVLDVNSPLEHQHLNNELPWTTYTPMYLEHIFKVVDQFSGYANTLAFLAGNEVVFDTKSAKASPNYIKAVVRDLKAYITNHVARPIPVGYSNADDLKFRSSLAHYLECGEVGYIDFWGVNSYQWCGENTFSGSGYDKLVEDYSNYTLPIFFTEFGCNESPPRLWEEIEAIYSPLMTDVFAGGLVYEFTEEPNNYGIVEVSGNGAVETMKDYTSLQKAYKAVPQKISIPGKLPAVTRPKKCPAVSTGLYSGITANMTLPTTLGAEYIESGVTLKTGRGKFIPLRQLKTSKYRITLNGRPVSDPTIKVVQTTTDVLPAGGHGQNTGGGVGDGAPTSDDSEKEDDKSAAVAIAPRGIVLVASLAAVAASFGLFL